MLCRGGASAGTAGWSNAAWGTKRATAKSESYCLRSSTSSVASRTRTTTGARGGTGPGRFPRCAPGTGARWRPGPPVARSARRRPRVACRAPGPARWTSRRSRWRSDRARAAPAAPSRTASPPRPRCSRRGRGQPVRRTDFSGHRGSSEGARARAGGAGCRRPAPSRRRWPGGPAPPLSGHRGSSERARAPRRRSRVSKTCAVSAPVARRTSSTSSGTYRPSTSSSSRKSLTEDGACHSSNPFRSRSRNPAASRASWMRTGRATYSQLSAGIPGGGWPT